MTNKIKIEPIDYNKQRRVREFWGGGSYFKNDDSSMEKALKEGKVMLWGLKKIDVKILKDFKPEAVKPKENSKATPSQRGRPKKAKPDEVKENKAKEPVKREFNKDDDYEFKDLPFLKEEYERITKEMMKKGWSDEEQEKWDDLQADIDEVIENLEALSKFNKPETGKGLDCITGGAVGDVNYKCDLCKYETDDKAKMARHFKTKKHLENLSKLPKEKQSLKNAEILAKDRKKRSDALKPRVNSPYKGPPIIKKLKPYYLLGEIPEGFREATQEEALINGKYGAFGKHRIDPKAFEVFQEIGTIYSKDLDEQDLRHHIIGLQARMKRIKTEFHYRPHGFSNFSTEQKTDHEARMASKKKIFDKLGDLLNLYMTDFYHRKSKPYIKQKFDINEVPKRIVKAVPITHSIDEPEQETSEQEESKSFVFEAKGHPELKLTSSHFTISKDPRCPIKLKHKTALKLYLKNIRLEPELYTKEDKEHFFYTRGGMIGMYNSYIDYRQQNRTFSSKVKNLLKKVGNNIITSIVINRTPVQSFITPVLNALTFGDFKKKLSETPYDKLYHLRLEFTGTNSQGVNQSYTIEKNELINMDCPTPKAQNDTEKRTVTSAPKNISLNYIIDKARRGMGDFNFFNYSATKNNCQDFCIGLFKYSGIGTKEDYDFIKQDVESVFRGKPMLAKFMDNLTGFAGEARTLMGGMITSEHTQPGLGSKIQSVLFKKPKWSEKEAQKWLISNDFHHLVSDNKPEHLRYRQLDPEMLKLQGYEFRTLKRPKGIEFIIAYKSHINRRQ